VFRDEAQPCQRVIGDASPCARLGCTLFGFGSPTNQVFEMAKLGSTRGGGTSRVRFIMLDAHPQRVVDQNSHLDQPELETVDEVQTSAPAAGGDATPRPARKPRVTTPKVLEIDLNSEPPFIDFATEKNPSSHPKRCLVAALWLKQARGIEVFTEDHIYTCYRKAKWPTQVRDFRQLLRNLKHDQHIVSRDDGFAINHLGKLRWRSLAPRRRIAHGVDRAGRADPIFRRDAAT
jgi:hypothetical protein